MDNVFNSMLEFLEKSNADCVAFAQTGDYIGGAGSGNFHKGLLRKVMNSFFFRTDRPLEFRGTTNEDVNMYTVLGSRGKLLLTFTKIGLNQGMTQKNKGGLTDIYLEQGTYIKSFYSVIGMPSAVKVSMMGDKHLRLHHKINWDACVPKILNEKWKK